METKHTAGNWDYTINSSSISIYTDLDTHPFDLATIHTTSKGCDDEEAEANAKLIAAAPQLLECLKKAHEMLHNLCDRYCRDKDGYLKENATEWGADLDITVTNLFQQLK